MSFERGNTTAQSNVSRAVECSRWMEPRWKKCNVQFQLVSEGWPE